jgi:predicted metalloprotease with PDZ domain
MNRKRHGIIAVVVMLSAIVGGASCSAFAQEGAGGPYVTVTVEGGSDKASFAYLGVYMDELTQRMKDKLKFPHESGVLVTKIEEGSPAEKAGLLQEDILYLFNGVAVKDAGHLASLVRAEKPGSKVALVIYRDGSKKRITVTLGERKKPAIITDDFGAYNEELKQAMRDAKKSMTTVYKESLMMKGRLGMVLHDLSEELGEYFDVKKGGGALVLDVETDSPAGKAGIRSGDVIIALNGEAVTDVEDFMDALSEASDVDTVSIDVIRKGAKRTIELDVESGSDSYNLLIAPFERSKVIRKEPVEEYFLKRNRDDAAKLKEEMKTLQERLQELEDRLGEVEKEKR